MLSICGPGRECGAAKRSYQCSPHIVANAKARKVQFNPACTLLAHGVGDLGLGFGVFCWAYILDLWLEVNFEVSGNYFLFKRRHPCMPLPICQILPALCNDNVYPSVPLPLKASICHPNCPNSPTPFISYSSPQLNALNHSYVPSHHCIQLVHFSPLHAIRTLPPPCAEVFLRPFHLSVSP